MFFNTFKTVKLLFLIRLNAMELGSDGIFCFYFSASGCSDLL